MVEIELDGKKVEVAEGSMVMHAADKAGTYIPHFCYHKKLSIAANCRMCLVDVEKAPKPMPACATPVTQGMIVRTKSEKAIKAQQSVMEFLLINHPLDCPICDQGGECQLQDLAVGYGGSSSRYEEEKRVVFHKDVGPLISMEEMSRCIHCTRCVRFGQEVAGVMELGMSNRGEHSEIETFVGDSVDSELSGNMIDICPVGALTSKPFRYSARTWELSRRKSVSPHDSTGANLIVQVKNNRVMRVVPLENEDVNECWIADRDRFSYEALNGPERLTQPMLKQGGQWQQVDWQTALEYVANGLKQIKADHGAQSIGTLVSPHSTLEELQLATMLTRELGSDNIDYRLRNAEFAAFEGVRWLGTSIASLTQVQRALVVGSNLRKEHPLFAQRIRQAVRKGAALSVITSASLMADRDAWAINVAQSSIVEADQWVEALAAVAAAIGETNGAAAPLAEECTRRDGEGHRSLAAERRAQGHPARQRCRAPRPGEQPAGAGQLDRRADRRHSRLPDRSRQHRGRADRRRIPEERRPRCRPHARRRLRPEGRAAAEHRTGVRFGRRRSRCRCHRQCANGRHAEPLQGQPRIQRRAAADRTVHRDPGTFVNAEGRLQGFHAVVKPLGETRPAWKVLRVLANLLGLPGFAFESTAEVLATVGDKGAVPANALSNATSANAVASNGAVAAPVVASIYQLDSIVRRAPSLQLTADARNALAGSNVSAGAEEALA